jgi:cold shock CspA family protein
VRFQGRITDWKDDRGFGFIIPNGGGAKVFVHITEFGQGQRRPSGSELVTYELVNDKDKGPRAQNVRYVGDRNARPYIEPRRMLRPLVFMLLVAAIGIYGWQHFTAGREAVPTYDEPEIQPKITTNFQCQGKQYCSEMTSCEEAMFYLKNCPEVEIDGDSDGIPCESQWCGQ